MRGNHVQPGVPAARYRPLDWRTVHLLDAVPEAAPDGPPPSAQEIERAMLEMGRQDLPVDGQIDLQEQAK